MQFHSVYLQRRKAGLSYREFQRLWRSHGDFAAKIPEFWNTVERYVHNDPVENTADLSGETARFDAVGELYYTSYPDWLAIRDVMWQQVAPDEKRVFAGPPQAVRGIRTVFQVPTGDWKLFTLARFHECLNPVDADTALGRHVAETPGLDGFGDRLAGFTVTRSLGHDPASRMDESAQTASSHHVLLVHHFASEDDARAAMRSGGYARLEVAQDGFFDWHSRIVVLTRGWILKGGMG